MAVRHWSKRGFWDCIINVIINVHQEFKISKVDFIIIKRFVDIKYRYNT